jgi:purine-binding chemotaxis protein CheW
MDFLEIRKKAKERARARAAGEAAAPAPAAEAGSVAPAAPKLNPFTTWRPGAGAAPPVPTAEARDRGPDHPPRPEDFALVAPSPRDLAGGEDPGPGALALEPPAREPADPLEEFFFREDEAGPPVPELAAPGAPQGQDAPVLVREEFLTFFLAAEEFAVAIERVREVVRSPPITEVPRAPAHILGVVTVRGEVVAVIDPRLRLGLAPGGAGSGGAGSGDAKIIIVHAGDGCAGLRVDRVAHVVRLRPGSIEPCPQGVAGQRAEFIAGIGREGDRLFTVLDVPALLRRAPQRPEGAQRRVDAGA